MKSRTSIFASIPAFMALNYQCCLKIFKQKNYSNVQWGSLAYQKWLYEIENDANCDDASEMHGQAGEETRRANCPVHCGFILPPSKALDNDTVFARQREWSW